MANYELAFRSMINKEGGYVNDPDDPGGETYKGIARKKQPDWIGWPLIDVMKEHPNFPANLDSQIVIQAKLREFYKAVFWDKVGGDQLVDQDVAYSMFDFGVNTGVYSSVFIAQTVVGFIGANADGKIGPNTIKAINAFNPDHFIAAFMVEKVRSYIKICKRRPDSRKYFFGWIDRSVNP